MFFSHNIFFSFFFKKKFLADTCPFLGPLVRLFWISGDVSSGFQSQSGFCLIRYFCGGECNVHSPRSTSGATLANLLAASVQPVTSPYACAEVGLGSDSNMQLHEQKTNALPLCQRLGFYHNIFLKTSTTIVIDGRQNTQICIWDYLQLPLAIAFIFTALIVHLIFYHFSNLHVNLSKW